MLAKWRENSIIDREIIGLSVASLVLFAALSANDYCMGKIFSLDDEG